MPRRWTRVAAPARMRPEPDMLDAKRLLIDAVCVAVLAILLIWGAEAIASVPITLPATIAGAHGAAGATPDCDKPAAKPKETTVAGGLPALNLAECGDAKAPVQGAPQPAGKP
jgi:hypothetical protein